MRAEVAVEIAEDITADFEGLGLSAKFDSLLTALQSQIDNPTPENQKLIRDAKDQLVESLEASRFFNYPVSLQTPLEEMRISDYLPPSLLVDLKHEFEGNDLTPVTVRDGVQKIKEKVDRVLGYAKTYADSSSFFEIDSDRYEGDEFGFSVTIPRTAVNNELDDFGRELVKLDKLLGVFVELSTGSREDFQILSISSTDLTVILESAPVVAVAIATALERVIAIYEKILNVVKLTKELKEANAPAKAVNEMENWVRKTIKTDIEAAAKDFEKRYLKTIEPGRRAELKTELRKCFREISLRVDRGYIFDIRGPEDEDEQEGETGDAPTDVSRAQRRVVLEVREKLRYFRIDDEPILGLPSPDDEPSPEDTD